MSMIKQVRQQLKDLGFRPHLKQDIESLGIELTVCQLIVVILSISSVVFLFVPFFYLQNVTFVAAFLGVSLLCLVLGIWFWMHKAEICEHPEDYQD